MLLWAREENWTALLAEESKYVTEVERLNVLGAPESSDFSEAHQPSKVLEQILEQGVEIRQRLIARRDTIGALMKAEQHRDRLSGAYGVSQAGSTGYRQMEYQSGL